MKSKDLENIYPPTDYPGLSKEEKKKYKSFVQLKVNKLLLKLSPEDRNTFMDRIYLEAFAAFECTSYADLVHRNQDRWRELENRIKGI